MINANIILAAAIATGIITIGLVLCAGIWFITDCLATDHYEETHKNEYHETFNNPNLSLDTYFAHRDAFVAKIRWRFTLGTLIAYIVLTCAIMSLLH